MKYGLYITWGKCKGTAMENKGKTVVKESRKTRYTRMVIRDSLIELMKRRSITDITIKEICDLADVSRPTFYAHYRDQYDLLQSLEDETAAHFESDFNSQKTKKKGKREIALVIENVLQYIENNSNFVQVILGENGDIDFQRKIFRRFVTYLQYTMKNHSEKNLDEEKSEYYSIYTINGIIVLVHHWLKNGMKIPKHELVKIIVELMGAIL
jgi:AcrR family transcriptional regulator